VQLLISGHGPGRNACVIDSTDGCEVPYLGRSNLMSLPRAGRIPTTLARERRAHDFNELLIASYLPTGLASVSRHRSEKMTRGCWYDDVIMMYDGRRF
jgi:hypothetical protein